MFRFQFFIVLIYITNTFTQSSLDNSNILFIDEDSTPTLNSICTTSENTTGICIEIRHCPVERIKLDRRDICYFEHKHPIICCEQDKVAVSTNSVQDTNEKPEKIVYEFNEGIFNDRVEVSDLLVNRYCSDIPFMMRKKNVKGHILFTGGKLSNLGDTPQMAAIGWRTFDSEIQWKCGGSLISSNFIITAAHCTNDRGSRPEVVRVGDLNLLKEGDTKSQDFNITKIFVHPQYRSDLLYHDIALLKITPNATFTLNVRPACLWTESDIPVQNLTAMGYGTRAFAGRTTNELFEGNLTHIPIEDCRRALTSNSEIPNGILETQICAKDQAGKADTCQGDSGGPLLFRTGKGAFLRQHLVGITSFGDSCAGPTPGVYTRVSSYIDWIESIVWPSGDYV